MTEKQFRKCSFKNSQLIDFISPRIKNIDGEYGAVVECFLLAVDFECETLKLIPVEGGLYEENVFYCSYKLCEFPKPKLRNVKKYPKKQTQWIY